MAKRVNGKITGAYLRLDLEILEHPDVAGVVTESQNGHGKFGTWVALLLLVARCYRTTGDPTWTGRPATLRRLLGYSRSDRCLTSVGHLIDALSRGTMTKRHDGVSISIPEVRNYIDIAPSVRDRASSREHAPIEEEEEEEVSYRPSSEASPPVRAREAPGRASPAKKPGSETERAWQRFLHEIRKGVTYRTPDVDDPAIAYAVKQLGGWRELGRLSERDLDAKRATFAEHFRDWCSRRDLTSEKKSATVSSERR